MTVLAVRAAGYDEIIADPMFRRGYDDGWAGRPGGGDCRWDDADQLAYERGRHFAAYVRASDGAKVPLARGYLSHPRARLLLVLAMRGGDVL